MVGRQLENGLDSSWSRLAELPLGEAHYRSRLSRDQVREIRRMYADGQLQREIGRQFDIHQVHVSAIVTRKIWAWLDD